MTDNKELCSICLEHITYPIISLKCKHVFHEHCIVLWINEDRSCPVCRRRVNINFPFIGSENIFYKNKIIIILNDEAITIFKKNLLSEIIVYSRIKRILNKMNHVKIVLNGDDDKKIYLSSKIENNIFFAKLKEKLNS
jgi:hypothetical protein